jgi:formylglycine-generating enzyme required for sulfatase activity
LPESEWCYLPNQDGKYDEAMKLAPGYLKRTGYRLPTEAEFEYACRAGALTSRFYGESEELLPKYGWCLSNSVNRSWPVGSLKPNDFGLFDVHGNVWTWCQEREKASAGPSGESDEDEKGSTVSSKESRAMRGGSFINQASYARCAYHTGIVPAFRFFSVGFRLARTLR